MNLSVRTEEVAQGRRVELLGLDGPLSQREYLAHLTQGGAFADWYTAQLLRLGGKAFFWEHPSMCRSSLDAPAQFVVLAAPMLAAARADPTAFGEHFAATPAPVHVFPSLGGDAQLVVPGPATGAAGGYGHLAAFLRAAPREQRRALWSATGRTLQRALATGAEQPLWLSTSGLGVPWLHVRIDQQPKYYQHHPYTVRGDL